MNWMGLATYEINQTIRTAWVVEKKLYDLEAIKNSGIEDLPNFFIQSINETLNHWENLNLSEIASRVESIILKNKIQALNPHSYKLCSPFHPGRIFAAASNYYEHAKEMGTQLAERSESSPFIFMKVDTCITSPNSPVIKPSSVQKLDWEVELGVVIGKGGRKISCEDALDHIAGYVVFNDISARDLTRRSDYPFSHDWFRGKSFETFGPMGPWLVPKNCLGNPNHLQLTLDVNGERMQDGNTKDMIFNIQEQIAYLSNMTTLKPGDLIATGTPTGVGMGRNIFLKPGDLMKASIEGIGYIENEVKAEDEYPNQKN
jgi:2-keto-4-pentenoate hydratase/2-oxohepta-3-ene-1,7-dioic acid hydratase in catechol pathway